MAKGSQFKGVPMILAAFKNMKATAWSVKYDKGIVGKYEGSDEDEALDMLNQFLMMLEKSRSEAKYSLNVYEDLPKGGKIKPSTEPDYSFNIELFDVEEYPSPYTARRNTANEEILAKLTLIEAKFAALDEEDEEDEEEKVGGVLGMINSFIEDPRVKDKIMDHAMGFMETLFKKPGAVVPMERQIGAVGGITEDSPILIDQVQHERLQTAINILIKVDAKLGDNLTKIAAVAASDPAKYAQMISMLNTFLA